MVLFVEEEILKGGVSQHLDKDMTRQLCRLLCRKLSTPVVTHEEYAHTAPRDGYAL